MRILLTANASYAPPRGGATRSNLVWLNHLARHGHDCRVVCGAGQAGRRFPHHESIEVMPVDEPARRVQTLRRQIAELQPDWVLVSSEDLGHGLLREAHRGAPGRVVYLAHTPQFFPFGPASWNPDPAAAGLVARIGRHRGHRPPHGGLHRARVGARRGGDPSADLWRRAVPRCGATSSAGWSP